MTEYYIPTIEEFHIGFEYEIQEFLEIPDTNPTEIKKVWVNKVWNEWDKIQFLRFKIKGKGVRVKLLSSDDMEDRLGFRKEFIPLSLTDERYDIDTVFISRDITVVRKSNFIHERHIIIYRDTDDFNVCIFSGKIQNVSELIRLINQLGLIEDETK